LKKLYTGEGDNVLICGEAGIGKTRLIQELILMSRQKEVPFYLGHTINGSGNMVYGSFIELFKHIIHKHPDLENLLPIELRRFIPGVNKEGTPIPHADKLAAKGYLFACVQQLFSELASHQPILIVIEDLHEADRASRELLSYLIHHSNQLPILFVLSLRKEDGEALPGYLLDLHEGSLQIIELAPFTYEEHVNLLHSSAANFIIGAETAGQIFRLSEGNPLYTLELLQNFTRQDQKEDGAAARDNFKQDDIPGSKDIPESIHHMVQQKLNKCSPPARHLLYIASTIGREVPFELLASIWGGDNEKQENGLFDAIEEVIQARILIERGLEYFFRHALVKETIYASISEARRRILHKQVATRLLEIASENETDVSVENIAYHFLGAKEYLKGTQYLIQAGHRAEQAYAHEDALIHYQKANSILDHVTDHEALYLRCDILQRIGDVYRASGQLEKSFDVYKDAVSVADECSLSDNDKVELYRKMSVVAIFRTDIDLSKKYLDKAFELVDGDNFQSLARLSITKALHLWHLNRLEEAFEVAQTALYQAQKAGATAETSQAYEILAMICLPLGRWEEGLKYEMERKEYGWSPEIVVATDAHLCLWEYHVSGDEPLQQAKIFMDKISEQATGMGDLRCVAVCHYALGTMHLWRGDRRNAVEELSSSLELHEKVGSPAGMAYSLARKSVLHTLMGAHDSGWNAVKDGLAYAEQATVRDHCLQRLYGVGIWNRLEANDHNEAKKLVKKSEELLLQSGACAACALELYPWLSYYYLQTGQIGKTKECGEQVAKLAEATGNPIGKAISYIIDSSISALERKQQKSSDFRKKSYEILAEAVPETKYSPVAHFINRMVEQQQMLV
jgi:tetratricopeptide (TPR) repeat protein